MGVNVKVKAEVLAQSILTENTVLEQALDLTFGDYRMTVRSNDAQLLKELTDYFSDYVSNDEGEPHCQVFAIETDREEPDVEFVDWFREGGKSGRKDAICDLEDGRLLNKVRTGMNYVQTSVIHLTYGRCRVNISQVINFILSQHMTYLQHQGAVICHASAIAKQGRGIAFSAFSGGGKSTLALHIMNEGLDFVSNDRLFVKTQDGKPVMYGVAKQPRINPGTILNNEALKSLIGPERTEELMKMPKRELWELEEKYDAPIPQLYGADRFHMVAELQALVILNWDHDSELETSLEKIDLENNAWLLEAVMKSPGPFHYSETGTPWPNGKSQNDSAYREQLAGVEIYQLTGKVDFEAAKNLCLGFFE